ncbi:hypothetical protein JT358_02835 [Micrococcales bacterium 31B]|nr:hypothetical protein [Micrococcales bacterium 31B]
MNPFSQLEVLTVKGMETPQGFVYLSADGTSASNTSVISFDGKSLTVNVRQSLQFGGSPLEWSEFNYEDLTTGATSTHANTFSGPAMPAYSLGHYARMLAAEGTRSATFLHIVESTGEATLAELAYSHDDEITDGDGILHSKAAHYALTVGGAKVHDYWVSNGLIVRTDWPIATSLYTRHPAKALESLPEPAAAVLQSLNL